MSYQEHYQPDPDRDRREARKRRLYPRRAQSLDHVVGQFMQGPEVRKAQRNKKIISALKTALTAKDIAQVTLQSLRHGTLTLGVTNTILLSELRNHRYHKLLQALSAAGTGVTKINLRLSRQRS